MKCFKPFTSIGLDIFIYYFKCKLEKNNKKKKEIIHKIKENFLFKLTGKIFQLQIRTHIQFLTGSFLISFYFTHWCS